MNFIPIEYDFHPNEFHTYGMNSASMTFIPTAVRSSYRECEKTSVIPKLRVNFTPRCLRWQTALLGQRSSKSLDEKSIYAQKKIYSACKTIPCTILGDVFCSIHDVNVHVNNDVLVQTYCRVFIKLCIM